MNMMRVPCAQIRPDPQSAGYAAEELQDLIESIRSNGLLRPILVRKPSDGFVIVHGERRWRAMQLLGHATIPAWPVLDFMHRSDVVADPARFRAGSRGGAARAAPENAEATDHPAATPHYAMP